MTEEKNHEILIFTINFTYIKQIVATCHVLPADINYSRLIYAVKVIYPVHDYYDEFAGALTEN